MNAKARIAVVVALSMTCFGCGNPDEGNGAPGGSVPAARVVAVSAGSDFACARLDSGRVVCWGQGNVGQLGDGLAEHESCQQECSTVPVVVANISTAAVVEAGQQHACAALQDGTVACWGNNEYGACGPAGPAGILRAPVVVSGVSNVAGLALETWNSCALTAGNGVSCWGRDYGTGPFPIPGLADARQIDSGREHTCALRQDGTVACWGDNFMGMSDSKQPTVVQGLSDIVQIACGGGTCLARSSQGQVYCWGDNRYGQCGIGQTSAEEIFTAVSVPGLDAVTTIAFGGRGGGGGAAAVLADGTVVHWGDRNGDKGLGDTTSPAGVPDATGIAAVAVGWGFSVYMLGRNGSIAAWGMNGDGELGDGSEKDAFDSPTNVLLH